MNKNLIEFTKTRINFNQSIAEFFLYNNLLYAITTDNSLCYSLNGIDFYDIAFKRNLKNNQDDNKNKLLKNNNEELTKKEIIQKLNKEMNNKNISFEITKDDEEISEMDDKDKYFINVLEAFNNKVFTTNNYEYEPKEEETYIKPNEADRVMTRKEINEMIELLREDKTNKMRKICKQIKSKTNDFIKNVINVNSSKKMHPTSNIFYTFLNKITFVVIEWVEYDKRLYKIYYSLPDMVEFDEIITDKEYNYISPLSYINGYYIAFGKVENINAINLLYSSDGIEFKFKNIDTLLYDNDLSRDYGINVLSSSFNSLLYPLTYKDNIYVYMRNIAKNKYHVYSLKINLDNLQEYATKDDMQTILTKYEILQNKFMSITREITHIKNEFNKLDKNIKKCSSYVFMNDNREGNKENNKNKETLDNLIKDTKIIIDKNKGLITNL